MTYPELLWARNNDMSQFVHDSLWSGLSAGSWWLVNVTSAARSPSEAVEILTSVSFESTVDRYPLSNCACDVPCWSCGLSKEKYD